MIALLSSLCVLSNFLVAEDSSLCGCKKCKCSSEKHCGCIEDRNCSCSKECECEKAISLRN